eukprot:SAG22_NODE_113_length_19407_cov_214.925161_19_plen_387_part_00
MKYASAKYLDELPTSGNEHGRAFRDTDLEQQVVELTQNMGIGAQVSPPPTNRCRHTSIPGALRRERAQLEQKLLSGPCHLAGQRATDCSVPRTACHGLTFLVCRASLSMSLCLCLPLCLCLSVCAGPGSRQFGGKYFCHDVRVIRLPRHGASCPVGIGVSCSADRQAKAKITADGIFLEQLEPEPSTYLPDVTEENLDVEVEVLKVDLNQPMSDVLKLLDQHPIKTRLSLSGTLVVARDIAHAKIKERLDNGEGMPQYMLDHPVYYAGPAKTPDGMASGSFGPTTAGRMDSYVSQFQAAGGSMVMLAKGNRSRQVTKSCKTNGGFYLGSIGGPAAILAQNCIKKVEVLDYPEDGMEAVWRIEVQDFPAFIVVDNKGNDFFKKWSAG